MKKYQMSITLMASLLLIFINMWVTLALGFVLAGMRLMIHLVLKNHIKTDHIDLFDTKKSVFGTLSKLILWDGLKFDQTKVLIEAVKKGNYFDVVIALYAGADAELGMLANIASSEPNQETIKNVLIHFGAEFVEGEDDEALFVDELDLDQYYPIRDLSMNFLVAEGIVDENNRPIKLDQIKGVLLAVERFGVRKIENIETTLSQNSVEVIKEEEIDNEIRSFLSRFALHETIRDEQLTFYSKAQRVPCINPLCQYGKVVCHTCNGEKTQNCDQCNGSGLLEGSVVIAEPVSKFIKCLECNGTGAEPGLVIEIECECKQKVVCKVCDGKGIINQDYCHNCEGSGKVCALCGGSGVLEITEEGSVCKTCGGAGVIETETVEVEKLRSNTTSCGNCEGAGNVICKTCLGTGKISCDRCEGQGHMFRNVKLDVILDAFPDGDKTFFIQFDQEEMNQLFTTNHAAIIKNLRDNEDVKVYRHEDRMVGKLFHNPTNPLLAGVNKFLGEIEAPYNQTYERVEMIVAIYHYVTFKCEDGTVTNILLLNNKKCLLQ